MLKKKSIARHLNTGPREVSMVSPLTLKTIYAIPSATEKYKQQMKIRIVSII